MKFLDLFAGIGGFRLGLEQAGHECVGWVEWDKHARKSYETIHDTKGEWSWNDISTIDYRELPESDIWCFGFPCQDISIGGKQQGFKGNRSSLFFATTERLRQIKRWNPERMPTFLFIENVKNFLSVNDGWDFLFAQAELDEIGYDCEWQLLVSKDVGGVPQNRERVYIIGHLRGRSTRRVFPIGKNPGPTPLPRESGFKIINNTKQGYDFAGENDSINFAFPGSNTRRGRVGRGYFQTLDTQCTQAILDDGRWRRITPREAWRIQGFPDWAYERAATVNTPRQLYKQAGNSVTVSVIYEIAKKIKENENNENE